MKKIYLMIMSIIFLLCIGNIKLQAENISDYIIMTDIAPYERYTKERDPDTLELKTIPGYWIYRNAGVLAGADHFQADHNDVTYKAEYQSKSIGLGIVVQVTQHTGGDSDRWLLHEIDAEFRTYYGIPDDAYMMRQITTSNIITDGTGGWTYRWLSSNKVINIEYTDLQGNKPEPLEVVQAYLAKFPSTLPTVTSADLRTKDNQSKWIKDEIDRRLWLCDKWNAQFQAGKTTQKDLVYNLNRSIGVFLNYRQKYYGVSAEEELAAMGRYYRSNDLASIQTKLKEYKTWWAKHKDKRILLP